MLQYITEELNICFGFREVASNILLIETEHLPKTLQNKQRNPVMTYIECYWTKITKGI